MGIDMHYSHRNRPYPKSRYRLKSRSIVSEMLPMAVRSPSTTDCTSNHWNFGELKTIGSSKQANAWLETLHKIPIHFLAWDLSSGVLPFNIPVMLLLDISPPLSNIRVWDATKIYKGGIRWVGNAAMLNSKPFSKWLRRDTAPQPLQSPPQNSMRDNERTTWQTTVVQWNLQGTIWMNTFLQPDLQEILQLWVPQQSPHWLDHCGRGRPPSWPLSGTWWLWCSFRMGLNQDGKAGGLPWCWKRLAITLLLLSCKVIHPALRIQSMPLICCNHKIYFLLFHLIICDLQKCTSWCQTNMSFNVLYENTILSNESWKRAQQHNGITWEAVTPSLHTE